MNNPAQLWLGSPETLNREIITFLQRNFCVEKNGCGICHECTKIANRQHHAIMWLTPEKQYTLNLLEPIFKTISFTNEEDQSFFFVLERADLLTPACANSLLKSVEEPPRGYNFIFLAQRVNAILPTIKSRCITKKFNEEELEVKYESFLKHFKIKTDPMTFLQMLDNTQVNEHESIELIDLLLHYWNKEYLKNSSHKTEKIIELLHTTIKKPPVIGGSKIFWKNLYLSLPFNLCD